MAEKSPRQCALRCSETSRIGSDSTSEVMNPRVQVQVWRWNVSSSRRGRRLRRSELQTQSQAEKMELLGMECLLEPKNGLLPPGALIDAKGPCQIPSSGLEIPE